MKDVLSWSVDVLVFMFAGITDDDLRETAYEILLACAGATGYWALYLIAHHVRYIAHYRHCISSLSSTNQIGIFLILLSLYLMCRGLIVPSKEKKKEKKSSRLLKKLGRNKPEHVAAEPHRAPGLVGLLETMRVQMEVVQRRELIYILYLFPFQVILMLQPHLLSICWPWF